MHHVQHRFRRGFLSAMAAYVVVLLLSLWGLVHVEATVPRALLALAPMAPLGLAGRAVLRFVRDCDELHRKILLEAFSFAALVMTLGTFSLGLLAITGVASIRADLALILILPVYCGVYGLSAAIARRRYL